MHWPIKLSGPAHCHRHVLRASAFPHGGLNLSLNGMPFCASWLLDLKHFCLRLQSSWSARCRP